jgi:ribonucleotide reductase beta subunit family protein with ferritin-like domain
MYHIGGLIFKMSTLPSAMTEVDEEWEQLLAQARNLGIAIDEIRRFFRFYADLKKEEQECLVENHTAS